MIGTTMLQMTCAIPSLGDAARRACATLPAVLLTALLLAPPTAHAAPPAGADANPAPAPAAAAPADTPAPATDATTAPPAATESSADTRGLDTEIQDLK